MNDNYDAIIIKAMASPLALPIPLNTPAMLYQCQRVEEFWELAAHLFYRNRVDKKHKVPTSRKLLKKFEPWGDYFLKKWKLCEGCHSRVGRSTPYRDASEWFTAIVAEIQQHDFYAPFKDNATKGKREEIEKMRTIAAALENHQNPYTPEPDQIHSFRLIDAALSISNKEPRFASEYFIPCVRAWRSWINVLHEDKEIQAVFEDGGSLYRRLGPGNGRQKLSP